MSVPRLSIVASDAVQRVLARLPDAKRAGAGWAARCPAHDDRTPSLSVSEGRDRRALVRCHAGCDQDAVIAALGLTKAMLYNDWTPSGREAAPDVHPRGYDMHRNGSTNGNGAHGASAADANGDAPTGARAIIATYDYTDENGQLLYQAVRFAPKDFRQRRPAGGGDWTYSLGDARRVLYHLPEVLEAAALGKRVYVVEGEKDADALRALGLIATTAPMGAGKWAPDYADALAGADVVILPDHDDVGAQHAESIAASCLDRRIGCRIVRLPGLPPKGDVSDWLSLGGDVATLESLVARTPRLRAQKDVYRLDELLADDDIMRPPPPVVPYLAWAGRSTLLASAEKAGKSTLTGYLAAAVSTGAPFLDERCERGPVLLVGLEEFIGDAARRLHQFRADPTMVHLADRLPSDPQARPAALRQLVESIRPVLVVIDSLIAYSDGAVSDAGSSAQMGPLVQSFTSLAHDTGAAVVLIHHARKQDGKYRDSSAIGGAVDLIVEMFAPDEDADPSLRKLRSRGRVPARDVQFRYHPDGDPGYRLAPLGSTPTATAPSLEARIVAFLRANPGSGRNDVRRTVAGNDHEKDTILSRLLESGRVVNTGSGARMRLRVRERDDDSDRATTATVRSVFGYEDA